MDIEQLKKWCKEQAEYYEGEMGRAMEVADEGYYKYYEGMQHAYWDVYYKIIAEEHKIENTIV